MNRQYCGDSRDLFKYDLISVILERMAPDLPACTFVPLVTRFDPEMQTRKPGAGNRDLLQIFTPPVTGAGMDEYLENIRTYFASRKVRVTVDNPGIFEQATRAAFLAGVRNRLPKRSLIFFDPDTGMKETNSTTKHLKYSEVKEIADTMDPSSVLMIYQHFPRGLTTGGKTQYPAGKAEGLRQFLNLQPCWLAGEGIAFFFFTQDVRLQRMILAVLQVYAKMYPVTWAGA